MSQSFSIDKHRIGEGQPCFVIAEAGVNHNGDLAMAKKLIDAAQASGADAVKFQSFVTEELVTPRASKASYQLKHTSTSESQFEMLKKLELSFDQQRELQRYCHDKQILFLSTPFDDKSLAFLKSINVASIKVSSTDITNFPFLERIGAQGLPVLLSTGMSYLNEVEEAVSALRRGGCQDYALLHCTSQYPAPPETTNLRVLSVLREKFNCVIGYSDHTAGLGAAPYAVACGASLIEKHFTLDRHLPGPDHQASLEPVEFRSLVQTIRQIEVFLGSNIKEPTPGEMNTRQVAQKSIVASRDLPKGTVLQSSDLSCKRPSGGIPPRATATLVGKRLSRDLACNDAIRWIDIEGGELLS